jgi:lysophospholipase L1-like esterase
MSNQRIVVTALGDSISAGLPGWSPDPAERKARGANTVESQWEYWAERADSRLVIHNHGVGRQRADEIAARLDKAAHGSDVLVVQGGLNNIVQGLSPESAAKDLRWMVRRGKELGLGVVLADVLPWNNGPPGTIELIAELNTFIREIGQQEDVKVLPFHATLEDPDRPGFMAPAWTAEGNHPSVEGHRRLGELAFSLPPAFATPSPASSNA